MKSKYFKKLNYSLGDEDSIVEYEILDSNTKKICAVAGSGGRVLPLFAKMPDEIDCVDVLDEQLYLTQLRIESLRSFEFDDYCGFWGYPNTIMSPTKRELNFKSLNLEYEAKAYLTTHFKKNNWGEILHLGKFEQMMNQLAKVNKILCGKKASNIFKCENLDDQIKYFKNTFPHKRWALLLFILGNSTVLNSLLYKGEFPKKNIEGSTYSNFKRIFETILTTVPARESFFLQLAFWGKLSYSEGNLLEAQPKYFDKIKKGISHSKINYVNSDIIKFIEDNDKYNFISLSDVPSFMNDPIIEKGYLQLIKDSLESRCKVIIRGNLRVTNPTSNGFKNITTNYNDILLKEKTKLWKIDVYEKE